MLQVRISDVEGSVRFEGPKMEIIEPATLNGRRNGKPNSLRPVLSNMTLSFNPSLNSGIPER